MPRQQIGSQPEQEAPDIPFCIFLVFVCCSLAYYNGWLWQALLTLGLIGVFWAMAKISQKQESDIQQLKDEIKRLKQEKTKLEDERSEKIQLKKERDDLLAQLENHEKEVHKIQHEKDEIVKQAYNLQTYLRAKKSQVCELETSLTKAQQSLKDMQERKRKIQREKDEILKQKDNLRAEVHQLEKLLRESQQAFSKNMQRLEVENKELKRQWKKERSELLEQKESSERELRDELVDQRNSWQNCLRAKEYQVRELETSLATARRFLVEYQQKQPCDWVISRDEVEMTNECLGVGGWGNVSLGTFRGCKVAVKQMHELILSPHNRQLFEIEANIASKCRHPCLLQFIGATNDDGIPLFITELLDTSLRALLQQRQLADTEISIISLDVSLALNYLHNMKPSIIHRDVSSANVLLWQRGNRWRGKLSDYGTANFVQRRMTKAPGAVIYSAPEAVTPKQTSKIDVFSFGVLLCEMCTREMPDPGRRNEQVGLVRSHSLRNLVRDCLRTDPAERPDMARIIQEIETFKGVAPYLRRKKFTQTMEKKPIIFFFAICKTLRLKAPEYYG